MPALEGRLRRLFEGVSSRVIAVGTPEQARVTEVIA
jgi:hypothetical protein